MTEVQTDWKNAPEDATHWDDSVSAWYKIAEDSVFVYSDDDDVWWWSAYETRDINSSQGFTPRPESQVDWSKAPEGATHYVVESYSHPWQKKESGQWSFFDEAHKVWVLYVFQPPCYDYVTIIPRPTPTAIPEPKKLTQAVFDGLPPEYQWAAVDWDGRGMVYTSKPECGYQGWICGNDWREVSINCEASNWKRSLIEREPSVAEIVEAFAANPPNFDALINSVANAQTLAEAQAEIERLKVGHDRYEILRKLNVVQFQKLYTAALKGGVSFDQVVDLYGEFFDEN